MNIIKRAKAPTPKFFRILRNIRLLLAGIGGIVIASPVVSKLLYDIGSYMVLVGGVISAVSQITVDDPKEESHETDFHIK